MSGGSRRVAALLISAGALLVAACVGPGPSDRVDVGLKWVSPLRSGDVSR